mmetsp:Transcript_83005/g.213878  ORF Transcript_83005/g.213878 Transcript_83005/m.213878 type:complete len:298 (+) Transcript_83005:1089-1982(+)
MHEDPPRIQVRAVLQHGEVDSEACLHQDVNRPARRQPVTPVEACCEASSSQRTGELSHMGAKLHVAGEGLQATQCVGRHRGVQPGQTDQPRDAALTPALVGELCRRLDRVRPDGRAHVLLPERLQDLLLLGLELSTVRPHRQPHGGEAVSLQGVREAVIRAARVLDPGSSRPLRVPGPVRLIAFGDALVLQLLDRGDGGCEAPSWGRRPVAEGLAAARREWHGQQLVADAVNEDEVVAAGQLDGDDALIVEPGAQATHGHDPCNQQQGEHGAAADDVPKGAEEHLVHTAQTNGEVVS